MTAKEWNARYQIGQAIVVTLDDGSKLKTKTRSEAWTLGHGEPVVKYEGRTGCYLLSRIEAANE